MFQTSVEILQILQKTCNCSNKLHEKPCKADVQQLQDWTKPDLHTFKWHQIAANVLQIASNAFIKSAKSIAQLLQFSIKYASNMLQMWLTSNSFKSEPNQRCKALPATVLQMLQKNINCFKYASTMLHMLQKNTIAQDTLQIYHIKLHDKTRQADLHQLQNCT